MCDLWYLALGLAPMRALNVLIFVQLLTYDRPSTLFRPQEEERNQPPR